jgi:hypothetical protein
MISAEGHGGYRLLPHKGSLSLSIESQFSGNLTGVQELVKEENAFLKSLGLAQTIRDNSGTIISATQIDKYEYSPARRF